MTMIDDWRVGIWACHDTTRHDVSRQMEF